MWRPVPRSAWVQLYHTWNCEMWDGRVRRNNTRRSRTVQKTRAVHIPDAVPAGGGAVLKVCGRLMEAVTGPHGRWFAPYGGRSNWDSRIRNNRYRGRIGNSTTRDHRCGWWTCLILVGVNTLDARSFICEKTPKFDAGGLKRPNFDVSGVIVVGWANNLEDGTTLVVGATYDVLIEELLADPKKNQSCCFARWRKWLLQ